MEIRGETGGAEQASESESSALRPPATGSNPGQAAEQKAIGSEAVQQGSEAAGQEL